ncbi:MAG: DNA (cytosine-5-)-methyltransferase [Flexibacter sp. CG_4_10_14_3_um_filter_32_15]|nr:MAG: DNA (cytosine-5-)-methyltransferase [Flexibacter sp. CG_4_10_14_3_um_filter_32_15]
MKFIDLFCGIGGFRIAFEELGGECVFSADIDKYACKTYNDNFGDFPLIDLTKVDESEIPNFDILCAGFPCQPFSIGGLRKGFEDTRGTLFFDIERILRLKKPKGFILENVKGLVNHEKGKTLEIILNKLGSKINGITNSEKHKDCLNYNVFYKIINSKSFGVPQNRERIYIIGFQDDINFEFPSSNESKFLTDIIDKSKEHNTIIPILNQNIDFHLEKHKNVGTIKDLEYLLAYEVRKSRCTFRFDNLSPTLTAKMGTGGNNIPVLVNQKRRLTVEECLQIQGFPKGFKIKSDYHQSYKQIGNSVSVPVVRALAKEISKFI